jgi:hypothetical protein
MRYIRTVSCPICGSMNNVPENLDRLLKTEVFRGSSKDSKEQLKMVSERLKGVGQSVRDRIMFMIQTPQKIDPNDWIDVECVNTKEPYGRHTFRFHTGTGELQK